MQGIGYARDIERLMVLNILPELPEFHLKSENNGFMLYLGRLSTEELKKLVRKPLNGTLKYRQKCKVLIKFFKPES